MVETQNRKRTRSQDEDYHEPSDSNALVEHAEEALETAKQVRAHENKQRRLESFARNHPPLETLDGLVLERIFLYLDSPRDVQSFAFCAKYLRACLTPEIIIRSAVFAGGTSRIAISSIIRCVRNRSIHIPSTPRLHRLVNATKCERGDQCFAYNHQTKQPKRIADSGMRSFGLAVCDDCVNNTSHAATVYHRRLDNDSDPFRFLSEHYVEAVIGHKAGPVISNLQVKQAQATYPRDQVQQALNDFFESVDEAADVQDAERGKNLVSVFDIAESQYDAFEKSKEDLLLQKQQKRAALRIEKRRASAESIYQRLQSLVKGHDREDLILDCAWTYDGYCHFSNAVVDGELGELLRAPTQTTFKKLTAAVDRVKEAMDLLASHGFFSGPNFLPFLSGATHQKVLRQFCFSLYKYREVNALLGLNTRTLSVYRLALERLRGGKPFDALLVLLGPRSVGMALATSIRGTDLVPKSKIRILVQKVWDRKVRALVDIDSETKYRVKHRECLRECRTLRLAIIHYLEDPLTVEFVNQTDPPPHRPHQRFTRQDAVNKIFSLEGNTLRHLQSRNFAALRRLHRADFLGPNFVQLPAGVFLSRRPSSFR